MSITSLNIFFDNYWQNKVSFHKNVVVSRAKKVSKHETENPRPEPKPDNQKKNPRLSETRDREFQTSNSSIIPNEKLSFKKAWAQLRLKEFFASNYANKLIISLMKKCNMYIFLTNRAL
jgi:hypothetical protein